VIVISDSIDGQCDGTLHALCQQFYLWLAEQSLYLNSDLSYLYLLGPKPSGRDNTSLVSEIPQLYV
jgi:hypothetical protein